MTWRIGVGTVTFDARFSTYGIRLLESPMHAWADIGAMRWTQVGAYLFALILVVIFIEWCSTRIRIRLAHGRQS